MQNWDAKKSRFTSKMQKVPNCPMLAIKFSKMEQILEPFTREKQFSLLLEEKGVFFFLFLFIRRKSMI